MWPNAVLPHACPFGFMIRHLFIDPKVRGTVNPSPSQKTVSKKLVGTMADIPGSSSRPHGQALGDWSSGSVSRLQLCDLQWQGYLPAADLVHVRAGLTSADGEAFTKNFPNPNKDERVCFVSFLLRGLGFPINPFLRGLLEFYGIQLHHLTPNSILHIA